MKTELKDKHILMDIPMPIRTPRLTLRPVQAGDGAEMNAAKAETWDQLYRWMNWAAEGIGTPDEDEIRARRGQASFLLRENFWLVGCENDTGRPVIWTGLHDPVWDVPRFSIGYWVRKSAQGKGYATESTNALLRYAFNQLSALRVGIGHSVGNDASRRAIEKLGFAKIGIFPLVERMPDGRIVDGCAYARTNLIGLPPLDVTWG